MSTNSTVFGMAHDTHRRVIKLASSVFMGALGLMISVAAWAQPTLLEQVDVLSSRYGTELQLHADQPVQHRVIEASSSTLVLELKGVVTPSNVRTDFSQAGDVRHVIFQPNGKESLKVTIRGENLGKPLVQVIYPTAASRAFSSPVGESASAMPHSESNSVVTRPLEARDAKVDASKALSAPLEANTEPAGMEMEPVVATALATPAVETPIEATAKPAATAATDASAEPAFNWEESTTPAVEAPPSALSTFLEVIGGVANAIPVGTIASTLAILGLLAGFGWFVRNKWAELSQGMATSQHSSAHGQHQSFRHMARERQSHVERQSEQHFSPRQHPAKANKWGSRPKTRLHQPVQHAAQTVERQVPQKNQFQKAMRQYQEQQLPPTPKAQPRQPKPSQSLNTGGIQPMAFERISRAEAYGGLSNPENAQRLAARKSAAASKAGRSLPRPNAGEPLPSNPNVLNFLRDVASYMEQDGDKHRARTISKSLRQYE